MGILLVFTLCVCIPRSFSQSVTQTPAAVTRKECQSLTITCVYYGYYYLQNGHFFKQTQTGTEWERISSGERFVVSVNKAGKTFSLEIRDVRVEDTATYYCKAQYRYNIAVLLWWKYDSVDGSGTMLTVIADSSSIVSQNPPVQTSAVGDTVTLSCEYSGVCQYTVHWYRQSPGQAPEYLLQRHASGEEDKENAVGGRSSASIDPAEKISRLNISKLQLSDSAGYYCALSQRTAQ
ncbi:T cell receptor alpha chain MC.7.G5-like [Carcharodon carcharias]|uniref:T cell receptor alpha chain MC.7.G5-like n=1 Tax=Carcharodon carcharias TaxID=13397 RepID=UPI001B7EC986|nr:T cell receptor alpha chain MC.7.G5-like [Carcharodon carcharias]